MRPRHVGGRRQPTSRSASSISAVQQLEHVPRARLAADGEPPRGRTADQRRPGAERECCDDVDPAADAAVDQHLDPAGDRVDDLLEHVDRRGDASSWRPPWFETTIAAAPCSQARRASSPVCTPLSTTGSPESAASCSTSRQVTEADSSFDVSCGVTAP